MHNHQNGDHEWLREKRDRERAAAASGLDDDLAEALRSLRDTYPDATWHPSASRGELEVTATIGGTSVRLRRRANGERWRCSMWCHGNNQSANCWGPTAAGAFSVGRDKVRDLVLRLGYLAQGEEDS